jgi:hypothetical protein
VSTEAPAEQPAAAEEQSNRFAGACVLAIVGGGALFGVVTAFPESAYVVVGVLGTVGVQRGRGWLAQRGEQATEDEPEEAPVDITEHLRALSDGGTSSVLLTQLKTAAGLPDTRAVRNLLDAAGIPVRSGVRTSAGNGPGVHQDDIPAPLPAEGDTSSGRCLCSSEANANANNGPQAGPGEGLRVEAIGHAGRVVHDPAESHRHHQVRA